MARTNYMEVMLKANKTSKQVKRSCDIYRRAEKQFLETIKLHEAQLKGVFQYYIGLPEDDPIVWSVVARDVETYIKRMRKSYCFSNDQIETRLLGIIIEAELENIF